jgi:hypothetical protein
MSEVAKDRRWRERRIYERRLRAIEDFIVSHAGHCKLLDMRITPGGCMKIRNHKEPQMQCKACPGVVTEERRVHERRADEDRRAQND